MKGTTSPTSAVDDAITGWLLGRLPDGLYSGAPEITGDSEEIQIVGPISDVELPKGASGDAAGAARSARIARFRQETRDQRIRVAREAEHLFGRKISWGATCGDVRELFTTLGVPVMTRLRLDERRVLDTLIDAGVARSRSEALAWAVRLVASNEEAWIANLRNALASVEQVRKQGPGSGGESA